ncbi:flagellin, partial [Candidatus Liberibacter asiaticus]
DNNKFPINAGMLRDSYESFVTFANMTDEGQYLFSGINSSEKPLNGYFTKDSLAKKSFDQMLQGFLEENSKSLLAGQHLEVSSMNAQQMTDFIKQLEDKFSDDEYWANNWSNASDHNIKYRIKDTEGIDVSANVNMRGIRDIMFVAVIGTEFLSKNLTDGARNVLTKKMLSTVQQGLSGIIEQRAVLGISEKNINEERVFLQNKNNIIDTYISKSIGVEQHTAHAQLSTLINKIEMSYMITTKLQKLSILNYL